MSYTIYTAVEDLREGDYVDLQGDKYGDSPEGDLYFEDNYAVVDADPRFDWDERNDPDGSDTTFVYFNWPGEVGFPRGHRVPKLIETDTKVTESLPDHAEHGGD